MADVKCDKCDKVLAIGDYPFCPHGRGTGVVVGDECDVYAQHGLCNADGTPRHYTSKAEMKREAEKRGLVSHVEHVGLKGSDKSPHTSRWI